MVGKGAPKGNQNAAKEERGESISLYLSHRDIAFLERLLQDRGEDPNKWRKFAREYARRGIYREIKSYMDAMIY